MQLLQRDDGEIDRWLAFEAWLFDRYLQILQRRQWVETIPNDLQAPLPMPVGAADGQMLLLAKAWRHAQAGDDVAARALLEQDLVFWRMVLRSSDLLIAKMVSSAQIARHFRLGNAILRELQVADPTVAPPRSWTIPVSADERSMLRALAGEWRYATGRHGNGLQRWSQTDNSPHWKFLDPLFKVQATNNLYATHIIAVSEGFAVDYRAVPQAVHSFEEPEAEERMFRLGVYNPLGPIVLMGARGGVFNNYAVRVSDLEGARRAALLAHALRADGVDATSAEAGVNSASLRDPYTDKPFAWDPETHSIVFTGLASGERGRHDMLL